MMNPKYVVVEIIIAMSPQIYVARVDEYPIGMVTKIPFYSVFSGPYDSIGEAQDEIDDLMVSEA